MHRRELQPRHLATDRECAITLKNNGPLYDCLRILPVVQPYRARQIKAIQYRHRIIWYHIQSNNLPTIEQTGANVSARGPRRALFASPFPSRGLRLSIATASVAITAFRGVDRLQPQDESARDANNASVVTPRLAAKRLFEHSAIIDSSTGDDGQAAVSNRFHY